MSRNELLSPGDLPDETAIEGSLRPKILDEFIGQEPLRAKLGVILEAARQRGHPPEHLLFSGPPGLGKTTLAGIVAAEVGTNLRPTSGPSLERPGDLAAMLTNLGDGDIFFVDEIHRLPRAVEEVLYPAMEDFQLDVVIGKGPTARSIRLDLPHFTLVGATTRAGLISSPLRDRFGFTGRLDFYSAADLAAVITRSALILGVPIDATATAEIARRARGTPRIANRLLRRVRDFAEVRAAGTVDIDVAAQALELFEVDLRGLDKVDRAVLEAIAVRFSGGPVGLSTLAIAVGEEPETVEEVHEPFLLLEGFLARTPRGRVVTPAGYRHLGLSPPPTDIGPTLFEE